MSDTERKHRQEQSSNAIKQNYRAKEVSQLLSCGLSTVWLYVKQGKLTPVKLSDRVTIFRREDLENFINANFGGEV